ncbi:Uncharacterised protein [uncultured archaeon]|nr:Uncharacterised protein [uncultured archaeon]
MHLQIWHIVLICILMIPVFLIANYIIVKRMAANQRSRDDRIERTVSDSVAASFADKSKRFESWPKYKARQSRKKG